MAVFPRTLVPALLLGTISVLVIALLASQGAAQLSLFAALLPVLILAGLIWYLIVIIVERNVIIEAVKLWVEGLIRQRPPSSKSKLSALAQVLSFAILVLVFALLVRARSVREAVGAIVGSAASVAAAGQQLAGQVLGSAPPTAAEAAFGQVMAYGTGLVFGAIITISATLVLLGAIGGLRKAREDSTPLLAEASTVTLEVVRQTSKRIKAGGDFQELILVCYKKMCELLTVHGAPIRESQTPREFEHAASRVLPISQRSLGRLTRLFELARYSIHPIADSDRREAVECLREIEHELARGFETARQ